MSVQPWSCYSAKCPTRFVLDRIADKWTVMILALLVKQPLRFNALLKVVDGLSQKVLSQTLKRMERDGLVSRTAFATVPVTVEYSVTAIGSRLAESLKMLIAWAEENVDAVTRSQHEFDLRLLAEEAKAASLRVCEPARALVTIFSRR